MLLLCPTLFAEKGEFHKFPELTQQVKGIKGAVEILSDYAHPLNYFRDLKVENTKYILNGRQRYQIARMLMEMHYYCLIASEQGYNVELKNYPILQLAKTNFTGFSKCKQEGGYWTHLIEKYFSEEKVRWGVTSTFENQMKPEAPHPLLKK